MHEMVLGPTQPPGIGIRIRARHLRGVATFTRRERRAVNAAHSLRAILTRTTTTAANSLAVVQHVDCRPDTGSAEGGGNPWVAGPAVQPVEEVVLAQVSTPTPGPCGASHNAAELSVAYPPLGACLPVYRRSLEGGSSPDSCARPSCTACCAGVLDPPRHLGEALAPSRPLPPNIANACLWQCATAPHVPPLTSHGTLLDRQPRERMRVHLTMPCWRPQHSF